MFLFISKGVASVKWSFVSEAQFCKLQGAGNLVNVLQVNTGRYSKDWQQRYQSFYPLWLKNVGHKDMVLSWCRVVSLLGQWVLLVFPLKPCMVTWQKSPRSTWFHSRTYWCTHRVLCLCPLLPDLIGFLDLSKVLSTWSSFPLAVKNHRSDKHLIVHSCS